MYFEFIFDSFNECLSNLKVYGPMGAPMPWERICRRKDIIEDLDKVKKLVKEGFKKLSEMSSIYCGILAEDKQPSVSKQV